MGDEEVALLAHRFDPGRVVRVIAQFAAQAGDGHIHAAILTVIFSAAQAAEQGFPPQDLAGVAGKLPQQIKVGSREGNALAIETHIPPRPIDQQTAKLQLLRHTAGGGDRLRGSLLMLAELQGAGEGTTT